MNSALSCLKTEKAKPLVLFAHGKESGPWGSKIKHLAQIADQHGAKVSPVARRAPPPNLDADPDSGLDSGPAPNP